MFANKVVLVTGGSSGIGAATAILFAKEKALVAFVGRNEAKLKEVAEQCHKVGAKTLAIKADITKDEEARTVIKQTVDKFGRLDVLVNNAAILRFTPLDQPNYLEIYDEVMNTNLRATILITNLAIYNLKKTKGSIVIVSSASSAIQPIQIRSATAYSISKAAIDRFTKCAAMELAPFGIRVNSVSPGPVLTDIIKKSNLPPSLQKKSIVDISTALGRIADADEVGDLIVYLASDKAKSITGSNFVIDNGLLLI